MFWFGRFIDRQAEWVATWLYSRSAFIWLVYGTILWIPLVVLGLDPHGFLYLYVATSMSLVTQVPLAMLAYRAQRDAAHSEEITRQTLTNQTDMMRLMLEKFGGFEHELDEIVDDLRGLHDEEVD